MIFFGVLVFTATLISAISGWFSITGLVSIFPASPISIMLMGVGMELGKLVSASWLYRNWQTAPKMMRRYFSVAVVVLSMITSIGVFGFLTKSHIDGSLNSQVVGTRLERIDEQLTDLQSRKTLLQNDMRQLDQAVSVLSTQARTASRSMTMRNSQRSERQSITVALRDIDVVIDSLRNSRLELTLSNQELTADVGPLRYIAEMVYGNSDTETLDKSVRWLIIIIMSVFDPLAILLVVAANMQLDASKKKQSTTVDTSFDEDTWFDMVDTPSHTETL